MLESIVSHGLALGAVYALIGITYNVMFAASRVFSFTAGTVGMLGGVFGALFINRMGMPVFVGFLATLAAGAVLGIITEIVTVRPVLKSLDQHLYVLSTLAFALMIQQLTAIEWSTEPQPFPRLLPIGPGIFDQQFWLPLLACAMTIVGLEWLYRRTLVGRAFLAISEDNYAARALGLPEQRLRMASYALAGVIGTLAGFSSGEMMLAYFGNGPLLNFYGFVPVALGGMGSNRGAVVGGIALGLFQQTRERSGGRHLCLGRRVRRVHHRPAGAARGSRRRCHRTARMKDAATSPAPMVQVRSALARLEAWMPILVLVIAGARPAAVRRFLSGRHWYARVHLLGARLGPQPGGRVRRADRHRLGGAADARGLRHERVHGRHRRARALALSCAG